MNTCKHCHVYPSKDGSEFCPKCLGVFPSLDSSPSSRAVVCCYCGKAWSYDGKSPKDELVKEAVDHEAVCEKNPYTAQIAELVSVLRELSGLCERAWDGMVVGKPTRNDAIRLLRKYPLEKDAACCASLDSAAETMS
jgi:hypothetical protein